jgi:peptide-methionine (S)-S-oxide reductase
MKIISYVLVFFTVVSCTNAQTKNYLLSLKNGHAVAVLHQDVSVYRACFEAVVGVDEAISGYSRRNNENPSYEQVGSNRTGHAESIAVFYDQKVISYKELVNVFFASQDPTTPNQQGPDRGSSYRSIFLKMQRKR